ncbi:MAG: hypothetical protein R2717_01240 [Schumannella sp.]
MILVGVALAVWVLWLSADLQAQVYDFYASVNVGTQVDEETYRDWDRVSQHAYLLQTLASPLLLSALVALLAGLAALAWRRDAVAARARTGASAEVA